jgi:beta-galactosidase
MLVIDETFDCWRTGKNPSDYHLFFEDWWQRDTESMVKRDRNHPSVIIWSIGNEVSERTGVSEGYAWCQKQVACVRSLDNTRPVTSAVPALFEEVFAKPDADLNLETMFDIGNPVPIDPQKDRWGIVTRPFFASLDVGGYNYLNNRYEFDSRQFPERVICGTETFPHQAFAFWESTRRLPNVIGDFVWTSLDYLGESGIGKPTFDAPVDLFSGRDPWPFHLAHCGDIDICGFKRPQSHFRDILWGVRSEPWIGVLDPQHYGRKVSFSPWGWEPVIDSWTFQGWEGKPARVEVYCRDEEVELRINGVSVGRKPAGAASQNKAVFEVVYEPGAIEAVGYTGGQATGKTSLQTSSRPAALRLAPDRPVIHHQWGDLAYVTVEVVGAEGRVVSYADPEVELEMAGVGDLVAVGAANPVSEELYVGASRRAYQGRLMAVVRSNGQPGEIALSACAEGLISAHTRIQAR